MKLHFLLETPLRNIEQGGPCLGNPSTATDRRCCQRSSIVGQRWVEVGRADHGDPDVGSDRTV